MPQSCLLVLPLRYAIEAAAQQACQLLSAWVMLGHDVEQFDDGHGEPSLRPSPAMLALSGMRVGPEHLVCLVPCVSVEAGGWVESAAVSGDDLADGVVVYLVSLLAWQCG